MPISGVFADCAWAGRTSTACGARTSGGRARRCGQGTRRGSLSPGLPAGRATTIPVRAGGLRSEEHTSELQSLMRISYAVFCLKKTKKTVVDRRQHTRDKKELC